MFALAAAAAVNAQNNTVGQGIITVQNAKFVDSGCREYQFAGGYVTAAFPGQLAPVIVRAFTKRLTAGGSSWKRRQACCNQTGLPT